MKGNLSIVYVMLTTSEVAAMADTTRYTVEREIRRGNLTAQKVGRNWVVEDAEAKRWAGQFEPYGSLRKPKSDDGETGEDS
jgi:excisionase family DNA binding protein